MSRQFEGRFLHHGHAGLTSHHSSFPSPCAASPVGLYLRCREQRGCPATDSLSLGTQPCTAPSCSGAAIMALTSQAGGLGLGCVVPLVRLQGSCPAGSALKSTLACGQSGHVAQRWAGCSSVEGGRDNGCLPATHFHSGVSHKRCPMAGPETTLS